MNNLANKAVNGGLDDYYTKPEVALKCAATLKRIVRKAVNIVEPSAGDGSLMRAAAEKFRDTCVVGYDIQPRSEHVRRADWFTVTSMEPDSVVFGNPPFGFASNLAIRFFNHAASMEPKFIAFIVPRTFRKRSVQAKLSLSYELVCDEDIQRNAFYMGDTGADRDVPCCFQVWRRTDDLRVVPAPRYTSELFDFVKPEDGFDFAVRRVGGRAGQVLPTDEPLSEVSTYFLKARKGKKRELAKRLKLMNFDEVKDSTAGVRSISKPELIEEIEGNNV